MLKCIMRLARLVIALANKPLRSWKLRSQGLLLQAQTILSQRQFARARVELRRGGPWLTFKDSGLETGFKAFQASMLMQVGHAWLYLSSDGEGGTVWRGWGAGGACLV